MRLAQFVDVRPRSSLLCPNLLLTSPSFSLHRVSKLIRRLAWVSISAVAVSEQVQSQLVTILRCHCHALQNLQSLDLEALRDRRFPLPFSSIAQLPALSKLCLPPLLKLEVRPLISSVASMNLAKLSLFGSDQISTNDLATLLQRLPVAPLRSLNLGFCKGVAQSTLQELMRFSSLATLRLEGLKHLEIDVQPLSRLPLSKLVLHQSNVRDSSFASVQSMPSLTLLDIQLTETTADVFRVLPSIFPNLSLLSFNDAMLNETCVPHLERLTNLQKFRVGNCEHFHGPCYEGLKSLKNLTKLDLRSQPALRPEEWSFLPHLPHLQSLSVIDVNGITDSIMPYFADLKELRRLTLTPNSISFHGLVYLVECPLVSLTLKSGERIDDEALAVIAEQFFFTLEELNLQSCKNLSAESIAIYSSSFIKLQTFAHGSQASR